MKKIIAIIFLFFVINYTFFGQTEFEPGSYNILRIENEYKLSLPINLYNNVWNYLTAKYDNKNPFLKNIDSSLSTSFSEELFTDQYYDDKNFTLLKAKNGVRHRTRFVLSNANAKKNGRELMQIKLNNISNNSLDRGEFKYPIRKKYKSIKEENDLHPFLGFVERDYRNELINTLSRCGIDAYELKPTIKVNDFRRRIYIYKNSATFISLTLDSTTAEFEGNKKTFIEIEYELNEIMYTEASPTEKAKMESVNKMIKNDLTTHFPAIKQDQTPKYNKSALAFSSDLSRHIRQEQADAIYSFIIIVFGGSSILLTLFFKKNKRLKNPDKPL